MKQFPVSQPGVQKQRLCPFCRTLRPPTGGGFCNQYCERMWREEQEYGVQGEFEADIELALYETSNRPKLFYLAGKSGD